MTDGLQEYGALGWLGEAWMVVFWMVVIVGIVGAVRWMAARSVAVRREHSPLQ